MPKISVIIPVYNVEKYLPQALESVMNQTFSDLEIVCVNDGSTDNSLKILEEYAQKDERIKIINQENSGYGAACNRALENITGEYFAILEPDDYIEPKMYEELLRLIVDNNADIAKCTFSEVFDFCLPVIKSKISWSKNFNLPTKVFSIYEHPEFLYFHPSIWSCLYKTSFVKENNIKFPTPKGAGWADNLFQVKTLCLAKNIIYTDEPYYNYRKYSYFESDMLKDFKIPFERSNEIHEWLISQNIKDKDLLACLHKRELIYIKIVLEMIHYKDIKECFNLIDQMIERMKTNLFLESKLVDKKEKRLFKQLMSFKWYAVFRLKFNKQRKKLISIRLNKKEKAICVGGRMIYGAKGISNYTGL